MTTVQLSELVREARLAEGGNATLWRCRWRGQPYLYKEFRKKYAKLVNETALQAMVRWRISLPSSTRNALDKRCAWPRAVVYDVFACTGIVIPLAPAVVMRRGRDGRPAARMLSNLDIVSADLSAEKRTSAAPAALAALGHVAQTLRWLHSRDAIVNDVHPGNMLVAADGSFVYLVDCDSMVGPWGQVVPAMAPPYLNDVLDGPPSVGMDMAKLAWCSYFLLNEDFSLRTLGIDARERMERYVTSNSAKLLAEAARNPGWNDKWSQFWTELANVLIHCGQEGILLTDAGMRTVRPVTSAKPRPQPEMPYANPFVTKPVLTNRSRR